MKILVGLYGGGKYGYNALRIASRIAKGTGSRLTVMYVAERTIDRASISDKKKAVFEKVDEILKEKGVAAKKKFVARKRASDAILEESEQKYDLVVLGSTKFSGLERMLFGSVSYHVAEFANVPVLVVKTKTDKLKKILVCTDGSKSAKSGCLMGTMLGKALDAEVTMLTVAPEFIDSKLTDKNNEKFADIVKEKVSSDIEILHRGGENVPIYTARPLEKSIDVDIIFRAGKGVKSVREEILKEAPKYDLIVCGSRGLGRIKRMRMGHVSLTVKENADANVLIARRLKS